MHTPTEVLKETHRGIHIWSEAPPELGKRRRGGGLLFGSSIYLSTNSASSFRNWVKVKAPKVLGEATQLMALISLFVVPFILLVDLASSAFGDQILLAIVTLCKSPPGYATWPSGFGRAGAAYRSFARDDKEPGP
jgi:hypothetical protein